MRLVLPRTGGSDTRHVIPIVACLWLACADRLPRPAAAETVEGPSVVDAGHPPAPNAALSDASAGVTDKALAAVLAEHWSFTLESQPLQATRLGVHDYDDRIADESLSGIGARRARQRELLEKARGIDASSLTTEDRVTLDLFVGQLESSLGRAVCRFEEWTISPRGNPVTDWNELPRLHRVQSPEDAANLISRYRAIPQAIDDEVARLRAGAAAGLYANAESTRRVIAMVERQLSDPLVGWPLLDPARAEHPDWSREALGEFRQALEAAVKDGIRPALVRYVELLREILPHARPETASGIISLPMGRDCYAALVHEYTTLDLTPDEVHEIGLREIARIDRELVVLGKKVLGEKRLDRILSRLRSDRRLYFDTAEAVEQAAVRALDDARARIPDFFRVLPAAGCVVTRVPDYEAPFTTIAYYQPAHADGSKPGEYFVNVFAPSTRPRYEARVLAFHESIPGHHLQIAIAQELPTMPAFRKHAGYTVFVEGWALYTERLADEMKLYRDDLDRLGMLSFDAWRAGRLVVDTGLHAKGWSRSRAEKFLLEHTALTANNIENEVDRYIVWPGQALAYKIGQLEIWKLRRSAEEALGDKFDIKSFHDVVLTGGAVTLPILRERVAGWIESIQSAG